MSPPPSCRLLARGLLSNATSMPPRAAPTISSRPFTTSPSHSALPDDSNPGGRSSSTNSSTPSSSNSSNPTASFSYAQRLVQQAIAGKPAPASLSNTASTSASAVFDPSGADSNPDASKQEGEKPMDYYRPFKMSVYAHRQNTHITVSKPNGDAIISLSCGNIGFKKSNRKKFDSAYQLAAFVMDSLYRDGWHLKINAIELTLRGFGQGREAVTKALTGYEGRLLKSKFISVADATKIKFGGTRSPNPRRLG
ncbi:hypothetical protein MKZ38_000774 [Zalerion maritima]|uniref:Ribosomal protein S11 n=1 Tax=Zalerion maritima TaxID=339359 RepID=A0AAD5RF28_9PEZI|nr:hypothetical protein MKZ38_000774 [Zalerion maritima]